MAEKYGEVPPKFTKKWWEYFWDYYKWHVIITVVAVLIASVTIVQCATRPKYDMNVVYAGHMNYSEEEINKLKEIISERKRRKFSTSKHTRFCGQCRQRRIRLCYSNKA